MQSSVVGVSPNRFTRSLRCFRSGYDKCVVLRNWRMIAQGYHENIMGISPIWDPCYLCWPFSLKYWLLENRNPSLVDDSHQVTEGMGCSMILIQPPSISDDFGLFPICMSSLIGWISHWDRWSSMYFTQMNPIDQSVLFSRICCWNITLFHIVVLLKFVILVMKTLVHGNSIIIIITTWLLPFL